MEKAFPMCIPGFWEDVPILSGVKRVVRRCLRSYYVVIGNTSLNPIVSCLIRQVKTNQRINIKTSFIVCIFFYAGFFMTVVHHRRARETMIFKNSTGHIRDMPGQGTGTGLKLSEPALYSTLFHGECRFQWGRRYTGRLKKKTVEPTCQKQRASFPGMPFNREIGDGEKQ